MAIPENARCSMRVTPTQNELGKIVSDILTQGVTQIVEVLVHYLLPHIKPTGLANTVLSATKNLKIYRQNL